MKIRKFAAVAGVAATLLAWQIGLAAADAQLRALNVEDSALKGVPSGMRGANSLQTLPWVTSWATAPDSAALDSTFAAAAYAGTDTFSNQTMRLIVHPSLGGSTVRVRLSNELGSASLTVNDVKLALQSSKNTITSGSSAQVTFSGAETVTIAAGQAVESDAITFTVTAGHNVAVSAFILSGSTTGHVDALQDSYVAPQGSGDQTAVATLPIDGTQSNGTMTSWPLLTGLEVQSASRTIVAFGASVTDGFHSTVNGNDRWPNQLEARLQKNGSAFSMADEGLAGNRMLADKSGQEGLNRFSRDVLNRAGVKYVIIADLPVNDIGDSSTSTTPSLYNPLISGYQQMISQAHAQGLIVIGATLTPIGGSAFDDAGGVHVNYWKQVNQWIRTSGAFDVVVDFDAALEDPNNPNHLLPAYDSGDHLHPNDTGYGVIANSFTLSTFQ